MALAQFDPMPAVNVLHLPMRILGTNGYRQLDLVFADPVRGLADRRPGLYHIS